MFTFIHRKISQEEMRNEIFDHLYEMNLRQLINEGKVITDIWKEICRETAQADVRHIIFSNNLTSYYKRMKRGAV